MGGTVDMGAYESRPCVIGRYVFYNNSVFDGNDPAPNASDDRAIAPDKTALLPGQTARFANYTSYSRGINGIMIDVAGGLSPSAPPRGLALDDFIFRVGNSDDPNTWALAPRPSSITVRRGEGAHGSDRVTIVWPDGAIQKQWL